MSETHRPGCLEANMLAEYIDGGLEPRKRAEVEAHLAECEECYENFSEAIQAGQSLTVAAPIRTRDWRLIFAAAAAIVIAVLGTWQLLGGDRRINAAFERTLAASTETRVIQARVADASPWAPASGALRGAGSSTLPSSLLQAIADLKSAAAGSTSAGGERAQALAALMLGNSDDAVTHARAAVAADASAENHVLLSAALVQRFRDSGANGDITAALREADAAIAKSRELVSARFNRALALETLDPAAAETAWKDFLARETDPKWAAEGRQHLERLSAIKK